MPYTHARETLIRLSGSSQLGLRISRFSVARPMRTGQIIASRSRVLRRGRGLYVFPGGDVIVERATHQGSEQGSRLLA